ncbi:WD40 repeat domain-containing protein, partial [Micromonospora sp. LOL_015]|uniref:WD40 repeat domain-containing protein n=1 Tax=Micromonospora sp. LOL_015 TaxID=3345416 RepID=UPI003A89F1D5
MAVLSGLGGRHHIVIGGLYGGVRVWDPGTGDQLAELTGHTGEVRAVAVAVLPGRDRPHRIVTGDRDGSVRVWDPHSGDLLAELTGHTGQVAAVAVLPGPDGG